MCIASLTPLEYIGLRKFVGRRVTVHLRKHRAEQRALIKGGFLARVKNKRFLPKYVLTPIGKAIVDSMEAQGFEKLPLDKVVDDRLARHESAAREEER